MESASPVTSPASPALEVAPQNASTVNDPSSCTTLNVFRSVLKDFMAVEADAYLVVMAVSPAPPTPHAVSVPHPSTSTAILVLPPVHHGKGKILFYLM